MNRADVRRRHADVLVVDLPAISGCADSLLALMALVLGLTDEGSPARRTATRLRKGEPQTDGGEGYLSSLGCASRSRRSIWPLARVAAVFTDEPVQRHDQRYTEADIRRLRALPEWILMGATLRDRFGDSGMVGLCFIELTGETAQIDTLLMSCRALGRGVEDALVREALALAASRGARDCRAGIRFTAKNVPVRNYYRDRGFAIASNDQDEEQWVADLSDVRIPVPDYLDVETSALAGVGAATTNGRNGERMASQEQIARVRSPIAEVLKLDPAALSPESGAGDFAEWDSLGHLIVVSALEAHFGVTFTTEEILNARTVADFGALLDSRSVANRQG